MKIARLTALCLKNNAVNLDFRLEEGMKVEIKARLGVYHKEGTYQLYCENIKKSRNWRIFLKNFIN